MPARILRNSIIYCPASYSHFQSCWIRLQSHHVWSYQTKFSLVWQSLALLARGEKCCNNSLQSNPLLLAVWTDLPWISTTITLAIRKLGQLTSFLTITTDYCLILTKDYKKKTTDSNQNINQWIRNGKVIESIVNPTNPNPNSTQQKCHVPSPLLISALLLKLVSSVAIACFFLCVS